MAKTTKRTPKFTKQICIKLTPAQWDRLQLVAEAAHAVPLAFARGLIVDAISETDERDSPFKEFVRLTALLVEARAEDHAIECGGLRRENERTVSLCGDLADAVKTLRTELNAAK